MCYAKPGPRCSRHARSALISISQQLSATETQISLVSPDMANDLKRTYTRLLLKHALATQEWYETKQGQLYLQTAIENPGIDGDVLAQLQARLERGKSSRAAKLQAYRNYRKSLIASSTIELECSISNITVVDGDLSYLPTRRALISGLCGDLAQNIQNRYGGDVYFVCYGALDEEDLVEDWKNGQLLEVAEHALIESKTVPGEFMDAYGRKTSEEIKEYYGEEVKIIRGTSEMLQGYTTSGRHDLSRFADSVIRMDSLGESYDYLVMEEAIA